MSELISGKEAKLAWANGDTVQVRNTIVDEGFYDLTDNNAELGVFNYEFYEFRLKPKTITLNGVEIPAPFDPEKEEEYFYISDEYDGGYGVHKHDNSTIEIAAWRTEDEIKQVVTALRSVFNVK